MKRTRLSMVVLALLGLLFGAIFLGTGLWIRSSTQPIAGGVVVSAEVVDVGRSTNSDGNTMYTPVVDYVDPATGQTHRLTGSVSSSSAPLLGSQEEVSLVPGDPSSARIVGPVWFPWIFIGLGALVILGVLGGTVSSILRRTSTFDPNPDAEVGETTDDGHTWTMSEESASRRPPGFHPDPDNEDQLRYWDGATWTDNIAPDIFDD